MEEKILKVIAGFLVVFAVGTTMLLQHIPQLRAQIVAEQEKKQAKEEMDAFQMLRYYSNKAKVEQQEDIDFKQQLRITLPDGVSGNDIKLENDDLAREVTITIPDAEQDYFYDTPVLGNNAHMEALKFRSENSTADIVILMDSVVDVVSSYNADYLYVDFLTPHQVYDKVVVIDAGHGGNNSGAEAEGVKEKDVNLAIALKVKKLLEEDSKIGVFCTRMSDVNPTTKARIGLVEGTDADLLVSIHCNSMTNEKFSYINGTEVIYRDEKDTEKNTEQNTESGSKQFAQNCLEEVVTSLGTVNRGIIPADEVELVEKTKVPAALIEVGFLTNEEERSKLVTEEYQQQAAQGIYNAIKKQLKEGKSE